MTQPRPDAREDTAAMLAAAGITVTDEGKARARAKLAEADARWTPERWAELREQGRARWSGCTSTSGCGTPGTATNAARTAARRPYVRNRVGRLDAASAVLAAIDSGCYVLSAQPGLYAGPAGGGPIIPI